MNIPLARPDITQKERKAVLSVLNTPDLSLGPKLAEFEQKIAEYIGVKHAVCVNSGTSALHLILKSLGIKEGDEVITTPFSFIASSNCILFERARPIFADIDPRTLNLDADLVEKKISRRTKAILAVDIFGHPAKLHKLQKIAKKHNLKLIEDSCEALGSKYGKRYCGSFGYAGTFAFYPNKQITTGEGGMVVTDDKELMEDCKSFRNQGRSPKSEWLGHTRLGYNYRISEINCALGIAQLSRIENIITKRNSVALRYSKKLQDIDEIVLPYVEPDVRMSWFVYVIRLNNSFNRKMRDLVINKLRQKGVGCSNYFPSIHLQPFYKKMFGYKKGDFPVSECVSERTIALPFHNNIREEEMMYVVKAVKEAIKEAKDKK